MSYLTHGIRFWLRFFDKSDGMTQCLLTCILYNSSRNKIFKSNCKSCRRCAIYVINDMRYTIYPVSKGYVSDSDTINKIRSPPPLTHLKILINMISSVLYSPCYMISSVLYSPCYMISSVLYSPCYMISSVLYSPCYDIKRPIFPMLSNMSWRKIHLDIKVVYKEASLQSQYKMEKKTTLLCF